MQAFYITNSMNHSTYDRGWYSYSSIENAVSDLLKKFNGKMICNEDLKTITVGKDSFGVDKCVNLQWFNEFKDIKSFEKCNNNITSNIACDITVVGTWKKDDTGNLIYDKNFDFAHYYNGLYNASVNEMIEILHIEADKHNLHTQKLGGNLIHTFASRIDTYDKQWFIDVVIAPVEIKPLTIY